MREAQAGMKCSYGIILGMLGIEHRLLGAKYTANVMKAQLFFIGDDHDQSLAIHSVREI